MATNLALVPDSTSSPVANGFAPIGGAPAAAPVTGSYTTAGRTGATRMEVSRQWASRPDDERFLSLSDLRAFKRGVREASRVDVIDGRAVALEASPADPDRLMVTLPDQAPAHLTHWSFGQLSALVGAPASYLRKLPAFLAAVNLQHGVRELRAEKIKTMVDTRGEREFRAITSPDYGRIWDEEVVDAVMQIAGNGTGDARWKVPGVIEGRGRYNPFVDVTRDTTTLFASDRDIFIFLVDDVHPIQVGKLPNGDPDMMFRGFYVRNSEVGASTYTLATMYLRGVCCNRILWGVEGFRELRFRHSKGAPARFMWDARPTLQRFGDRSDSLLISAVAEAKATVIADANLDSRRDALARLDVPQTTITKVLDAVEREEGHPARSVWDFVQGITAVARDVPHQDARLDLERVAGVLLNKVKVG